jgi:hypothetical protein
LTSDHGRSTRRQRTGTLDPPLPNAPPGNGGAPRSERKRLRLFGLTVGAAFCILAAVLLWKQRPIWPVFAAIGGVLILLGALVPTILRPVERLWMRGARALGWVMTRVILGVVFVILFCPAGLIIRLLGKDPLELQFVREAPTYWHKRESSSTVPERMERMF